MRAIKLVGQVGTGGTLRVSLPPDVPEGPAEVIVLIPDAERGAGDGALQAFLQELRQGDRCVRSKEDIDRSLAAERSAWD
jgi:hypothetical protein